MQLLAAHDFVDAILDPRNSIDIERFGRSRVSPQWRLVQRQVGEHYLGFIIKDSANVSAGGLSATCHPGAAFVIAPNVPHDISSVKTRFTFYHWRFQVRNKRTQLAWNGDAVIRERVDSLQPILDLAYNEYRSVLPGAQQRVRALLAAVLVELMRSSPAQCGLNDRQQRLVLDLVARRLPHAVHPRELAQACGLSHDYFTRQFRVTFGEAPRTWMLHERLRQASEELLGSDETIANIATRWQFESPAMFNRQFKALFGLSPGAWRQQFR